MRNNLYLIIVLLFFTFTNVYPQLQYYGYYDGGEFFDSGNTGIPTNTAIISTIPADVTKLSSHNNIIVNAWDWFLYDKDNDQLPDINESSSHLSNSISALSSQLNYSANKDNILGFIIAEEPLAHSNRQIDMLKFDRSNFSFDQEYLKFAVSGNFVGDDGHDDIAMFYQYPDPNARSVIKVMSSNGNIFLSPLDWFTQPITNYNFQYVKFVTSGDYDGDGHDDIAVFYQSLDTCQIHIFFSNGNNGFRNNRYDTWFENTDLVYGYNFNNIKMVTSGDYDHNGRDDIAVLYKYSSSYQIHVFKSINSGFNNQHYAVWYDLSGIYNFDYAKFVTSGNFINDNNSSAYTDLAMFFDYPNTTQDKIVIFRSNGSNFNDSAPWGNYDFPSAQSGYNVVKAMVSGKINFDNYDDLFLFHDDSDGHQRILRFICHPEETNLSSRLKYAGNSVTDNWKKNSNDDNNFSFDNCKFYLSGNFYENNNGINDDPQNDNYWNKQFDDVCLFFQDPFHNDNIIRCVSSLPQYGYSNKKTLDTLCTNMKAAFPNKKMMIVYMESSTYIPDLFANADVIGVDPYVYHVGDSPNLPYDSTRILTSVNNILNNAPTKEVMLVGQAARDLSDSEGLRYPYPSEALTYYNIANSNSRIKYLIWWKYGATSLGQYGVSYSDPEAVSLRNEHVIIGNLILPNFNQIRSPQSIAISELQSSYSLNQNYPNPFNPTTQITYSLQKASYVQLNIYNILGKLVRTLVNEQQSDGDKTVAWNGKDNFNNNLPSGVYVYRLKAGAYTENKKMILLR